MSKVNHQVPGFLLIVCRPAYTKRLLLDTTEEAALRSYWLHTHQYTLPQEIPFFYEVSLTGLAALPSTVLSCMIRFTHSATTLATHLRHPGPAT